MASGVEQNTTEEDGVSLAEDEQNNIEFRGDRIPVAFIHRLHRKRTLSCIAILFTVFAERVAFFALSGNLFLFLNHQPLAWTSQDAMTALLVFSGTAFVAAFFTGYLGDTFGRFKVILVSLLIHILGFLAFVTIAQYQNSAGGDFIGLCHISNATYNDSQNYGLRADFSQFETTSSHAKPSRSISNDSFKLFFQKSDIDSDYLPSSVLSKTVAKMECGSTIYVLLIIIGLASSGVKANIVPFGAEQVKQEGQFIVRRYFTVYYWVVNVAAFLSILVLSYIQQSTQGGFGLGYIIPTVVLVIATVVFCFSYSLYSKETHEHSILHSVFQVIIEAWRQSRVNATNPSVNGWSCGRQWLDAAKIEFGGRFDNELVEDVKQLKFVVGVFTLLIPYWIVYFQMQTSFQEQGLHMRLLPSSMFRPINGAHEEFTIPAAWLTLFNIICVILFVPIFEKCVYPFLERRQHSLSSNLRILAGLICAAAAMLCAGGVEVHRLRLVHMNQTIVQVIDGTEYVAADLWVSWQIPAYAFIAFSEILASISAVELAYSHAPVSMQGVVMGLFYLSTGIGCFSGSVLLSVVSPFWMNSAKPDSTRLDKYFWLLFGIQAFSAIVFFFCIVRNARIRSSGGSYLTIR